MVSAWPLADDSWADQASFADQGTEPVPHLLNLSAQPINQPEVSYDVQPVIQSGSVGWPDPVASTPASRPGGPSGWLNLPGSQPDDRVADRPAYLEGFDELPHRESTLSNQANQANQAPASNGDYGELDDARALPKRQPLLPEPEPDTGSLALAGFEGLPVRVRQASLAPQLREEGRQAQAHQFVPAPDMAAAQAGIAEPGQDQAEAGGSDSSPEAARNFFSALQRGWERGRSVAEQLDDEPDGEQS